MTSQIVVGGGTRETLTHIYSERRRRRARRLLADSPHPLSGLFQLSLALLTQRSDSSASVTLLKLLACAYCIALSVLFVFQHRLFCSILFWKSPLPRNHQCDSTKLLWDVMGDILVLILKKRQFIGLLLLAVTHIFFYIMGSSKRLLVW